MTTIVGWADGTTIIMAADGLTTCGNEIVATDAKKILRLPVSAIDRADDVDGDAARPSIGPRTVAAGHVLIGVSGRLALQEEVADLAAHGLLPPLDPDTSTAAWVYQLTRAVYTRAAASPFRLLGDDGLDGALLVGVRGSLWFLTGKGGAVPAADGYQAIGSGASYALGALRHAARDPRADPALVVQDALAAAATFDVWTGGAIHVHIERPDGTADES